VKKGLVQKKLRCVLSRLVCGEIRKGFLMFKYLFCAISLIAVCMFLGCSDGGDDNGGGLGVGIDSEEHATDGEERTINVGGISIDVIFVAAGTFTQGGFNFGNSVSRQVTLTRGFWIGKYPVTQAQYQAVMGNNPSHFGGRPNNPVESVNWHNATEFASRVGGRLPTEAEWEFAAKGGNKSQGFIYSGSDNADEVAWFVDNSSSSTQAVGQKLPNELGIYDMSGNVFEWIGDWLANFDATAVTDPTGPLSGANRMMRGGSWFGRATLCRVAVRYDNDPSYDWRNTGFRVVFDLK